MKVGWHVAFTSLVSWSAVSVGMYSTAHAPDPAEKGKFAEGMCL